ncbi:hypothetical protein HanRHA438_Chr13g0600841 [Helianthus annuus]|nr:hypothetical protein HanHA89_Chr13g0516091 [Helianthus annuus]KAJ0671376.1 hypothetical protein HanOQP8_Chr13g0484811 [Helianthus annuus]KAJ0858422.1 hypothetical protein HanRHA438_Chr13g0600841 [Helianthus annuus]
MVHYTFLNAKILSSGACKSVLYMVHYTFLNAKIDPILFVSHHVVLTSFLYILQCL